MVQVVVGGLVMWCDVICCYMWMYVIICHCQLHCAADCCHLLMSSGAIGHHMWLCCGVMLSVAECGCMLSFAILSHIMLLLVVVC